MMIDYSKAFMQMGINDIMEAAAKFQMTINQTGKLSSELIQIGIPIYTRMSAIATNQEIRIMADSRLAWLKNSADKLNGTNVVDFNLWKISHPKKRK